MAEFTLGELGWSEEQLRRADLNAIWLAERGYANKQDDLARLMFTASGGTYPSKAETMPWKSKGAASSMRKMFGKGRKRDSTEDE